jgi:hypothetical protein
MPHIGSDARASLAKRRRHAGEQIHQVYCGLQKGASLKLRAEYLLSPYGIPA